MHSILIFVIFITFLIYLVSYIISSLSVVIRKFKKKLKFTSFETGWLLFFIGVFAPPPQDSMIWYLELIVLVIFVFVNFFWFIPLIHFYEVRIKEKLSIYFYFITGFMLIISGLIFGGWYGYFLENIWREVSDVTRGLSMGFSLIYIGYLVYRSESPLSKPKKYESYSLICIGISALSHGIFHIFVYGFGTLHEFDEIMNAPESSEVYLVLFAEFSAFAIAAFGFILLLLNMIVNSDYRLSIENNGNMKAKELIS